MSAENIGELARYGLLIGSLTREFEPPRTRYPDPTGGREKGHDRWWGIAITSTPPAARIAPMQTKPAVELWVVSRT